MYLSLCVKVHDMDFSTFLFICSNFKISEFLFFVSIFPRLDVHTWWYEHRLYTSETEIRSPLDENDFCGGHWNQYSSNYRRLCKKGAEARSSKWFAISSIKKSMFYKLEHTFNNSFNWVKFWTYLHSSYFLLHCDISRKLDLYSTFDM